MPKFKLIKEPDFISDNRVEMTFDVDSSVLAHEYFDDFLKASGFVAKDTPYESTGYLVRGVEDMEWDVDGELKSKTDSLRVIK
jgi:hypothetical protein